MTGMKACVRSLDPKEEEQMLPFPAHCLTKI